MIDNKYQLKSRLLEVLYNGFIAGAILYLLLPLAILFIISFQDTAYGGWPPEDLSLRWYESLPTALEHLDIYGALSISVLLAFACVIIATFLGGLAAIGIQRGDLPHSRTLETLFLTPLIYPWLITGFAILVVLGSLFSLSFWTLLVGHIVITLPFPVRTIGASLENYDTSIEEAARDLGATTGQTYRKITLPMIKPGIISGVIFVFLISFNNYIVSLFLSDVGTQTVPLVLFSILHNQPPQQVAVIGVILIGGQLALILFAEWYAGISKYL